MFTGIIQKVGVLESIISQGERARLRVRTGAMAGEVEIGDSVSISGVCLTAVEIQGEVVAFDVVKTTMSRTRLGALTSGDPVNLELALQLSDRLGGHLISGHIDGVGKIRNIDKKPEEWRFSIDAPEEVTANMIERGSVALDGISLTVAAMRPGGFEVAIIPHTLENTTMARASAGDPVNLECDMIGKWVARYMEGLQPGRGITYDKLRDEGFIH
ncbi:MAG: riboflavin synthase [Planctomycetota bacterium]|jgi:riboflavin synthase